MRPVQLVFTKLTGHLFTLFGTPCIQLHLQRPSQGKMKLAGILDRERRFQFTLPGGELLPVGLSESSFQRLDAGLMIKKRSQFSVVDFTLRRSGKCRFLAVIQECE